MQEIDLQNAVSISAIHRIAGVDLAYWNEGEDEYGFGQRFMLYS